MIVFVRPTVGDHPVMNVAPSVGMIDLSPGLNDGEIRFDTRYVSGPKAWVCPHGGWTGLSAFDADGRLLCRISTLTQPMAPGETLSVSF